MTLRKYQAYQLVSLKDRSILNAPAPGLDVYLAADVEEVVKEAVKVLRHWRNSNHPIGKCFCAECEDGQRLLARLEDK